MPSTSESRKTGRSKSGKGGARQGGSRKAERMGDTGTETAAAPGADGAPGSRAYADRPLVDRAINRTVAGRYAAAAAEIERIIEATYRVIERTGSVDPPMREILREAGLSTQVFYRHFRSKDELMLVLLDDGRRRLAGYLEHKMDKAGDPVAAIGAWIEGTLAQAADPQAASRTRPFITNLGHLQEQYPAEHRESVQVLVRLVQDAIVAARDAGRLTSDDPHADAMALYHLAQGSMEFHLRERSAPGRDEVRHLVAFALRALGAEPPG